MSNEVVKIRNGGCLCGAVRFEADGAPVVVAHCHCTDCQKLSGAGHSTSAMYSTDNFRLTGDLWEYQLESHKETKVTRAFCPTCGSSVLGRNSGTPNHVAVSLGVFDDPSDFEPQVTVFTRSKNKWDVMDETLPGFETQPDWKPEDGI